MFTIDQIRSVHSKVRSGADFPQYIRDLKALGVIAYKTFVRDGHTVYRGSKLEDHIASEGKYGALAIAAEVNPHTICSRPEGPPAGKNGLPHFL